VSGDSSKAAVVSTPAIAAMTASRANPRRLKLEAVVTERVSGFQ